MIKQLITKEHLTNILQGKSKNLLLEDEVVGAIEPYEHNGRPTGDFYITIERKHSGNS